MSVYGERAHEALGFSRWWQIVAAVVMMALVSPYQYVWSSIQGLIARDLGISLLALGLVFTLFVLFQLGSQFPAGWLRDRYGPRTLTVVAGVLAGGYLGLAYATTIVADISAVLARGDRRRDRLYGRGKHRRQVIPRSSRAHDGSRDDGLRRG